MNPSDSFPSEDAFGAAGDTAWEPQPICWPRLDRDEAYTAWQGLDAWIRWCVRRYGLDHRTIPPCWYRHGALIEELSALRTGWQAAHSATAPGNAPLEWHAMFMMARQRLQEWASRSGCHGGEHRAQQSSNWTDEPDIEFLTHVIEDGDRRRPSNGEGWAPA